MNQNRKERAFLFNYHMNKLSNQIMIKFFFTKPYLLQNLLKKNCYFKIHLHKYTKAGPINYLRLQQHPTGLFINISEQEKKSVHPTYQINQQITLKMQQLQNTGLSRQQILFDNVPKGIPLSLDPFFQFIKNHQKAREIYIPPGQSFNADKVIEIALRQDIGPDPSYSRPKQSSVWEKGQFKQNVPFQTLIKEKYRDETHFDSRQYYGGSSNDLHYLKTDIRQFQPIKYIYKPINRDQLPLKKPRYIRQGDIHWRNLQLITQFLNRNGTISRRIKTRLTIQQHRKIKNAIKTARSLKLLPHFGQVPLPMRRSLTSLQQEIQNNVRKQVNLETGHIFLAKKMIYQKMKEEQAKKSNPDQIYKRKTTNKNYKSWIEQLNYDEMREEYKKGKSNQIALMYTMYLKKKEYEKLGINLVKLCEEKKKIQTQRLKLMDKFQVQPQLQIKEDQIEECKECYEKEKRKKSFKQSNFIQEILEQKLSQ